VARRVRRPTRMAQHRFLPSFLSQNSRRPNSTLSSATPSFTRTLSHVQLSSKETPCESAKGSSTTFSFGDHRWSWSHLSFGSVHSVAQRFFHLATVNMWILKNVV
jgi:hypothetical protein